MDRCMNNVTVRLAGGLGNQLFQLFSAIFFVRNSLKTQIILDSRFLSSYETKMQLEIGFVLDVMHGFSIKNTPNIYMGFLSKFRVARLIDRCFFGFALLSSSKKLKDINCKKYQYVILDGYFQDPELISRREVTSIFKLLVKKNNYLKPIMMSSTMRRAKSKGAIRRCLNLGPARFPVRTLKSRPTSAVISSSQVSREKSV